VGFVDLILEHVFRVLVGNVTHHHVGALLVARFDAFDEVIGDNLQVNAAGLGGAVT